MKAEIREMSIDDYDHVIALWKGFSGIGLSSADEREEIGKFLDLNPHTSLVVEINGEIAGTALGGFDGRRGYVYHFVIEKEMQGRGLGTLLLKELESQFKKLGAQRLHLMIYNDNKAWRFYEKRGYFRRDGELFIMSRDI
ncbi:MAG: GNAT family N-acetyltransferase [Deltaproteobacteria bacterium]|uniref:GNAT family N-acetyltransferase n=1 Tax=Candidatus Zymogenus saltonus TaxID=2844893 RepID=A0A9D8PNT4_9DELT|nr:GNAT family N-acetyltransferase [Candidatus Zymogenus saltonus]